MSAPCTARKIFAIFKKELRGFFFSLSSYIIICAFLIAFGLLFFFRFYATNQMGAVVYIFWTLVTALAVATPLITMTSLSSEFSSGSYEILNTASVTTLDIILGKFFAATAFMLIATLPTIVYPLSISFMGDLDWGPVIAGYLVVALLIMALVAIGIFASSLTKNVIVSALVGLLISLTFCVFIGFIARLLPAGIASFVQLLAMDYHFVQIGKGVIDIRSAFYFLSVAFTGLYATKLVLDLKK